MARIAESFVSRESFDEQAACPIYTLYTSSSGLTYIDIILAIDQSSSDRRRQVVAQRERDVEWVVCIPYRFRANSGVGRGRDNVSRVMTPARIRPEVQHSDQVNPDPAKSFL